ncbi:MAG: glycosyltransferase [Bacteroidales bacterium]
MKILLLLSRLPYPLEKGDKLRAYQMLVELAKFHKIYLFCANTESITPDFLQALEPYCQKICVAPLSILGRVKSFIKAIFRGTPLQCAYFYTNRSKNRFRIFYKEVEPDVVYCHLMRMVPYMEEIVTNSFADEKSKKDICKILDYQDALSYGIYRRGKVLPWYSKFIWDREFRSMLNAEKKAFYEFDLKTIISEQDRELLPLSIIERAQVKISRNGVDTEYFIPNPSVVKDFSCPIYDIVFTGNMGYPPNEDAAVFLVKKILPLVRQAGFPTVKVLIAGTSPTLSVKSLASPEVLVTGWLEDMRWAYWHAKVFVAPMRIGTGMQNKLLEAMACALPCVSSKLSADGLGQWPGEKGVLPLRVVEVEAAQEAEAMAKEICILLRREELRKELGDAGRAFVKQHYTWSAQMESLKTYLDSFDISCSDSLNRSDNSDKLRK